MRKKIWIPIVMLLLVLIILFVPYRIEDGVEGYEGDESVVYEALLYKVVKWKRPIDYIGYEPSTYENTDVLFFADKNVDMEELWETQIQEYRDERGKSFRGTIVEMKGDMVVVEPFEMEEERKSSDKIEFDVSDLERIAYKEGHIVEVRYKGEISEAYPARVDAKAWYWAENLRDIEYTDEWLDKERASKDDHYIFTEVRIGEVYSNCFFVTPLYTMPDVIKVNGILDENWCPGDYVSLEYENLYYNEENHRVEVDLVGLEESDYDKPTGIAKPVIYLYPEEETEVSVKLDVDGELTCTYPKYNDGWKVNAKPDGTLTDDKGMLYNYLYWEAESYIEFDMSKGFCVKGEDTAAFLEGALKKLGLNRREANEFIIYWLPMMESNPYNIITFQTDTYTDMAKLDIDPVPDTLIRVFMTWSPSDKYVEMEEQELSAPAREGFCVVEWGGGKLD